MKFSEEAWETINQLLEEEYNACDDPDRRKALEATMEEPELLKKFSLNDILEWGQWELEKID